VLLGLVDWQIRTVAPCHAGVSSVVTKTSNVSRDELCNKGFLVSGVQREDLVGVVTENDSTSLVQEPCSAVGSCCSEPLQKAESLTSCAASTLIQLCSSACVHALHANTQLEMHKEQAIGRM
jgi:hypothetical protein